MTCLSLEATWLLYHIVLCLSSLFLSFFRRFYSPSRLWYTAFTFRPSRKISALLFKAWELIFPRFYLTGWHRSPASFGDLIIISQYVGKCNTECCINIEDFSQGFMWKCNQKLVRPPWIRNLHTKLNPTKPLQPKVFNRSLWNFPQSQAFNRSLWKFP